MRESELKWLVRLEGGKILGPFSTSKVIQLIAQGTLSGEESVATYPGGDWQPITRNNAFYDQLLKSLSTRPSDNSHMSSSVDVETQITKAGIEATSPIKQSAHNTGEAETVVTKSKVEILTGESNSFAGKHPNPANGKRVPPKQEEVGEVIELKDLQALGKVAKRQVVKLPVQIVAGVLVLFIAIFLMLPSEPSKDKIHLLAPQKGGAQISVEQVKASLKKAFLNYQRDDYQSYLEAQNELVKTVEGAPQDIEVRGLLCLTYKELWPYSYQDSKDLKTLNFISQSTKALDPVGLNGITCDSIRLMLNGRFNEARGILESALSNYPTSPVLYQLKGEVIAGDKDHRTALAYMQKASELWPTWLKSHLQQGHLYKMIGETQKARDSFRYVLQQNKKHKRALVYLGLLEHEDFRKSTEALEHYTKAMNLEEPLPKLLEAQMYLSLANIYVSRNSPSKALEYAQKSYALNSSNTESKQLVLKLGGIDQLNSTKVEGSELVFLGDQYRRSGDCFAAQAEFKAAYESDKKNAIAALKAGQCLWELNQVQEAISYIQKAIKADPNLMEAYVTEADYYSRRYNYLAASRVLNRARGVNPNSHELWRGYALVELRRFNGSGAIAYGQRALQLYDTDIETHIILAKAHMSATEYKDGFRYAAKAVELDATNSEAQSIYAMGLVHLQGVDSAVYYLENLINKFPYVSDYRLALAEVQAKDERFQEAQSTFQQVVDIYPNNKAAFIGLGRMQRSTGYMEEALKSFLSAASLDPSDAEALFEAGLLYLETGRFTIAIQQFERVLEINSLYPRVHYHMGKAALLMGDQGRALAEAEKEKKLNPNLADAYLLAAEAYSLAKSYSLCAGEYQKALKLRPQGAEIYVKVAQCYRKSGSLDVASAMLGLAKDKESGYAEIYKEQGALYEMQGEMISARQAYDLYLELSPNAPDRIEIERRLASLE